MFSMLDVCLWLTFFEGKIQPVWFGQLLAPSARGRGRRSCFTPCQMLSVLVTFSLNSSSTPLLWSSNLNFGKRARCCVRHLLFIFHEQICSTWSHYKSWRKAKKSRLACGHQAAYPPCQGGHLANWWAKVLVAIGGSCGSAQASTEWSGPLATLDLHSKNRASLTLMQRGKSWLADISGLLHGDVWLAGFYSLANEQQGCQYSMIWWDFCLFVIW